MQKPDVILIMSDQQRADFFAHEGFPLDTMPFLEQIAQQGCRFERAYTPEPICVPARVGILTGRYPKATGVMANLRKPEPCYVTDLPEFLNALGYETALFGKNHSHRSTDNMDVWREYSHTSGPKDTAQDVAFDEWMQQVHHWVATEPNPFPVEAQYPTRIVSDFTGWLETREADRPYFAWVSFPEPHSPYQVPEPYFSMFPLEQIPVPEVGKAALEHKNYQWRHQYETIQSFHPELDDVWPRYLANYCGMLRLIDDQLQRLFNVLGERGNLENTIVVYVSDHGEFCGDYGLYRKGLALPECSIRIPMILWGPGVVSATRKECYVSSVDIYPTICEFLGQPIPFGVQGRSLLPILQGEEYSRDEFRSIYSEVGIGGVAVTEDQADSPEFKAGEGECVIVDGQGVTNFDGQRVNQFGRRRAVVKDDYKFIYDQDLPPELYYLATDPLELQNLAQNPKHRDKLYEMMEELLWWSVRLDDNMKMRDFRFAPPVSPHNWTR